MSETGSSLSIVRDPRFSCHATADNPAWLWSTDGAQLLWANAAGAAIFGFETAADCRARPFAPGQLAASQIARLAPTLALGAAPRLEMLRGFGAGFGRVLVCRCSRVSLEYRTAILVVSTQPGGPDFSLAERARRLLAGSGEAVAAYSRDRALIAATGRARALLAGRDTFAAIDAEPLGGAALETGHAAGISQAGPVRVDRLGSGGNTILLATFEEAPTAEATGPAHEAQVPAGNEPAEEKKEDRRAVARDTLPQAAAQPNNPARRHPLRFVWQMDAEDRFTVSPGEFTDLIGPGVAAALNRPWNELAASLALDPQEEVARAIASRDTWSGIHLLWPMDGTDDRIGVELSGLPIYDRDRVFRGYRGFGVCRDVARIDEVLRHRAEAMPAALGTEAGISAVPPAEKQKAGEEHMPATLTAASAENVLPFRGMPDPRNGALSPGERNAFNELARQLTARLRSADEHLRAASPIPAGDLPEPEEQQEEAPPPPAATRKAPATGEDVRPLLNGLPSGVLIHRHGQFLYANQAFLDWTGHPTLADFEQAGGLDCLFLESGAHDGDDRSLMIETPGGDRRPTQARLLTIPWDGATAMALVLQPAPQLPAPADDGAADRLRELESIVDAAADGILVLDDEGRILTANRGAQILFGYDAEAFATLSFADLFADDCRGAALDDLHRLARNAPGAAADEGREVTARTRHGGPVALLLTMRRLAGDAPRFCAILRDITAWKKTEQELTAARQMAERSSSAKSEFLAKVSHEIRTPLNAIIGFSEVMMSERFGPIGNDRYREYLKDIHASGEHVVSLLNDLLDLSKIEAGKLDLTFADLNLNDLTQQSVALMQPEANRERIIIRTSLPTSLPRVKADARSVRQIILNLLSNSIKFTGAGGQVIVSTAVNDNGDVVLRVRDTGTGMSDSDIAVALEPFRQLSTAIRPKMPGTGLGLPLTKALAEANRASFSIRRAERSGTLVEIAFPKARIPAE